MILVIGKSIVVLNGNLWRKNFVILKKVSRLIQKKFLSVKYYFFGILKFINFLFSGIWNFDNFKIPIYFQFEVSPLKIWNIFVDNKSLKFFSSFLPYLSGGRFKFTRYLNSYRLHNGYIDLAVAVFDSTFAFFLSFSISRRASFERGDWGINLSTVSYLIWEASWLLHGFYLTRESGLNFSRI